MITPEQRKKLEVEAEEQAQNGGEYTAVMRRSFLRGAEAYARIQAGEKGLTPEQANIADEFIKDNEGLMDDLDKGAPSDEEALKTWEEQFGGGITDRHVTGIGYVETMAFLAGCARYRPLVEEMLGVMEHALELGHCGQGSTAGMFKDAIARAEKLLGKKDE